MANLTAARDELRQDGVMLSYPVAASTNLFQGSAVAITSSGFVTKAADTAGLS